VRFLRFLQKHPHLTLCSKSLRFTRFLKIFALFALSSKSLRNSQFPQNLCAYRTFLKNPALCSKSLHYMPAVSTTAWCTLSCEYIREFETDLIGYSGSWGILIHENNLKSKISWPCPFKRFFCFSRTLILYKIYFTEPSWQE